MLWSLDIGDHPIQLRGYGVRSGIPIVRVRARTNAIFDSGLPGIRKNELRHFGGVRDFEETTAAVSTPEVATDVVAASICVDPGLDAQIRRVRPEPGVVRR